MDDALGLSDGDRQLLKIIKEKKIPYLVAYNKSDLGNEKRELKENEILVSALKKENIIALRERIGALTAGEKTQKKLVGDMISPGDFVVLVTPIDESAPKGRLILPQQQTIRDILDAGGIALVTKETELSALLSSLEKKVRMVITDSQVFGIVSKIVPESIPLTSFSILMARYKGFLDTAVRGISAIDHLEAGAKVLIAEGCTHHRQCNDIGTVKIPRWLMQHTGNQIQIETCSGTEFPEDLSEYAAVIHCGGCMLNEREVQYRRKCAEDQDVPFLNYGILIAHIRGILQRSIAVFRDSGESF